MAKLTKSQKRTLETIASCIENAVITTEGEFVKVFQVTKAQAQMHQAKQLRYFVAKN